VGEKVEKGAADLSAVGIHGGEVGRGVDLGSDSGIGEASEMVSCRSAVRGKLSGPGLRRGQM
jgi:hypothetical protein